MEDRAEELARMTLTEHLVELRRRLVICVIAVTIGTFIAFFLYNFVLHFITAPYRDFLLHHQNQDISHGNLVTTGPLEGFTTRLKVSGYLGLFFASPVVLWELWRFITPGLHKNEKRYVIPFVVGAVVLFSLGVTVSILVFPKALDWLITVSGQERRRRCSARSVTSTSMSPAAVIFGVVFMLPHRGRHAGDLRGGAERQVAQMAAAGDRRHGPRGRRGHAEQRPVLLPRHGRADGDLLRAVDHHRPHPAEVMTSFGSLVR